MSPLFLESLHVDAALHQEHSLSVEEMEKSRRQDERAFFLVFALTFPFFLVAVLAGRVMMPTKTFIGGEDKARASLFGEASETARSTIALAFAN
jgi:hypothetical protein